MPHNRVLMPRGLRDTFGSWVCGKALGCLPKLGGKGDSWKYRLLICENNVQHRDTFHKPLAILDKSQGHRYSLLALRRILRDIGDLKAVSFGTIIGGKMFTDFMMCMQHTGQIREFQACDQGVEEAVTTGKQQGGLVSPANSNISVNAGLCQLVCAKCTQAGPTLWLSNVVGHWSAAGRSDVSLAHTLVHRSIRKCTTESYSSYHLEPRGNALHQ